MSLFVICKILAYFINPWTADDQYSLRNKKGLQQQIQMQISKKEIVLSWLFGPFPKTKSIFKQLQRKYDPHSLYVSKMTKCEKRA